MSDGDTVIQDEDLEFLLQASDSGYSDSEPDLSGRSDQITIRGELDKISLTDIFQTLAMSKMEGILRIYNPLENRLIYFEESGVRVLFANRSATRRLGVRLVQSGLVSASDLRTALISQSRDYAPLGEILIDEGAIEEGELRAALDGQHEEDLYALFTWQSGSFEFYKGVAEEAQFDDRVVASPCFQINRVLLEVARRSDEWEEILNEIGSLDCVPVFPEDVELPEMSGDMLIVCESIDEYSTVREIGDLTMLGLFNCAKAVCELYRNELIEFADASFMISLAREAADREDHKRALQISQSLVARADHINRELAEELAEVLRTCREAKLGAQILVACAESLPDLDARMDIGEQALALAPHSVDVLRFQRDQYVAAERTTEPRFGEIIDQLCTALTETGEYEDALRVFQDLESLRPDDASLLTRKAGLLQRVGRTSEALEILLKVKRLAEADGDPARVARVCEQILKVDSSRKDIAKSLRDIRDGKTGKRRQKLRQAATLIVVAGVVWFSWSWIERTDRFDTAVAAIRTKLEMQDPVGAKRLLAKAQMDIGEGKMWDSIRAEIEAAIKNTESSKRSSEEKRVRAYLVQAKAKIEAEEVTAGLKLFQTALDQKSRHPAILPMIQKTGAATLRILWDRIKTLSETMHRDIPGPVPELTRLEELRPDAAILLAKTKLDMSLPRKVLENAENAALVALMDKNDRHNAVEAAKELLTTAEALKQRYLEYSSRIKRMEKNHRLDPVYEAARKAEAEYDFETAEKLYRQLYDAFRSNATLAPRFHDRVVKFAGINKTLRLLVQATHDADWAEARAHYRHLRASYKDIPWAKLVRLPVRVVSTPPGAEVKYNNKPAGKSPLVVLCLPGKGNRIEITLTGYLREQTEFEGDQVGLVRSILTRTPLWSMHTRGVVERQPTCDDDTVYMVDRAGGVIAWSSSTKKRLWRADLGGLSGLLTKPVLYKDLVLIASIDGPLRALNRNTGAIEWKLEDLPSISTPVIHGTTLALATTTKQFVRIDLENRKLRSARPLSAKPIQDTVLFDGCALIVLADGTARAIKIAKNVDRWGAVTKLDRGVQAQPVVTKDLVIFSTDEGHLAAHDLSSGLRVWHRDGLGELRWEPVVDDERVYVATLQTTESKARVLSFDLRTGNPRQIFESVTGAPWSAPPAGINDLILVGDRLGVVTVLEKRTLKVLYKIQGKGKSAAKTTTLPSGELLCPFDGKEILVLPPQR